MKYWRGYLAAGIFAVITWGLVNLAQRFGTVVDMIFPYVTRTIQDMMVGWTGQTDFLVWQVLAVLFVAVVLATLVLVIILKWNGVRWLGWVLAVASFVYMLHTVIFGLNYYAGPLADDVRLDVTKYTTAELANAASYYRDQANKLATQVNRDENGDAVFEDFSDLALQAGNGFEHLTFDRSFSVFAGSTAPVKELGWADLYTSMGINGITMGITGEAAVNPQIPDVAIPFTMCHEMAHRMSIAIERDANFAGFLAASSNDSIEFQYSAYFMAFRFCYNSLVNLNTSASISAAARIMADVNTQFRHDLSSYSAFFSQNMDAGASNFANTVNDTYLKTSGDKQGTASYGDVTQLLVSWHIQEIVLPALKDEENKFDPFDENQVDLDGIVNAVDKPGWGQ